MLAQDADAVRPAVEKAVAEGIPVVGYDRLIEIPEVFYLTFDNNEVGRMQAREVFKVKPEGNYVFIKGSGSDPNANFLFQGSMEVLKAAIDAGKIKNVGEAYTDGWLPGQRAAEHGAVPDREQQQGRCGRSPPMTAPPAAPSRRLRRRAWPAPCRSPARTATRRR